MNEYLCPFDFLQFGPLRFMKKGLFYKSALVCFKEKSFGIYNVYDSYLKTISREC